MWFVKEELPHGLCQKCDRERSQHGAGGCAWRGQVVVVGSYGSEASTRAMLSSLITAGRDAWIVKE
jgi:hypothetical protein